MNGKPPEFVARTSTNDARAIDRSIDRFRVVSSRSRPSIESIERAFERAFGTTERVFARARSSRT